MKLYYNIRKLYTPLGFAAVRGSSMRNIEEIDNAAILVRDDGTIEFVGSQPPPGPLLLKEGE